MAEESLVGILRDQAFFKGMTEQHLVSLAPIATAVEYGSAELIFEEGGHADAEYVVRDGSVALELDVAHRAHHIVQTLHRGEVLGWSWLFPPYRWAFSALALDPVALIRFDAEQLRELLDSDCGLGYEMMKRIAHVMTNRLAATRLQLVDFYGHTH